MISLPVVAVVASLFVSGLCSDATQAELDYYTANDELCGIGISNWYPNTDNSSAFPLMKQAYILSKGTPSVHETVLSTFRLTEDTADEVVKKVFKKFNVQDDDRYSTSMKMKVFAGSNSVFTDDFKQQLTDIFDGTTELVDYSSDAAVDTISGWLGEGSEGVVKSCVNDQSSITIATITDVELKFDESSFKLFKEVSIEFTDIDGVTSTQKAYYGEGVGKYIETNKMKIWIFNLNGDFSGIVYQPIEPSDMSYCLNLFRDPNLLKEILAEAKDIYMKLTIPIKPSVGNTRDYAPELKTADVLLSLIDSANKPLTSILENESAYASGLLNKLSVKLEEPSGELSETITSQASTLEVTEHVFDAPFFYDWLCPEGSVVVTHLVTRM